MGKRPRNMYFPYNYSWRNWTLTRHFSYRNEVIIFYISSFFSMSYLFLICYFNSDTSGSMFREFKKNVNILFNPFFTFLILFIYFFAFSIFI